MIEIILLKNRNRNITKGRRPEELWEKLKRSFVGRVEKLQLL